MASAIFLFQNSLKNVRFLKKIFLLDNTNMGVVLEMLFLFFNNINMEFAKLGKFI